MASRSACTCTSPSSRTPSTAASAAPPARELQLSDRLARQVASAQFPYGKRVGEASTSGPTSFDDPRTDSSSNTLRFFLYKIAVRTLIDALRAAPAPFRVSPGRSQCRLSEIVAWRARPLVVRPPWTWPAGPPSSSSSSASPSTAPAGPTPPVGSE